MAERLIDSALGPAPYTNTREVTGVTSSNDRLRPTQVAFESFTTDAFSARADQCPLLLQWRRYCRAQRSCAKGQEATSSLVLHCFSLQFLRRLRWGYRTFSLRRPRCCRPAWSRSSKAWPTTGEGSISGSVLIKPQSWDRHGLKQWLDAAKKRLHRNILAIALANKLARIAGHQRSFGDVRY